MNTQQGRLYELLPVVIRQRDANKGYPLRGLMKVIEEQVDVVEADMGRQYDNWFIETCEDWVVPYIGDLVGYRVVHEAGSPGDVTTPEGRMLNKILIPRRDVADTIANRRRKGTLALLEELAMDVAGWPARAVEFYRLLAWTQHMNHPRPLRAIVDLHHRDALRRIDGPFDSVMHNVDVRRPNSTLTRGRYNIPSVGLFVWRLKSFSVSFTPACCLEAYGPHMFSFSALGNDVPLFTLPREETSPTTIAGELNVPAPISRDGFEAHLKEYYGPKMSLRIWQGQGKYKIPEPIPVNQIIPADLSGWHYTPKRGQVAVDPVLGRILFHRKEAPKHGVWVRYHYGFSDRVGGGEYRRTLEQPADATIYQVTAGHRKLNDALQKWQQEAPEHAVIEIQDSGIYVEPLRIEIPAGHHLVIRAADGKRPIIRLLDWQTSQPDALFVTGEEGSAFMLDGVLVFGRGMQVEGELKRFTIRHSTLVPGWTLDPDCEPQRPAEPSLELAYTPHIDVRIERSIVGSIQIHQDEVMSDPLTMSIEDSIIDATGSDCNDPVCEALGAPGYRVAHALLTIKRSTILGRIDAHAIALAENSIFMGRIQVARRQIGCMRFCFVKVPSRTPRRYRCQPDLVKQKMASELEQLVTDGEMTESEKNRAIGWEIVRVTPRFTAMRYGTPGYCQLSEACAEEIVRGADDESEMGVFHDLFQPQRHANLSARLQEYTPAGCDAGIFYVT